MKKFLASSVLATAALFPVLVNAEELDLPANMLVGQKVEIRSGATTSYPLVTSLSTGKTVTVIDEFTNSSGELWYRVDLGTNKGWGLASSFTAQSTGDSGIQIGKQAIITGDNVNVRKGATTSYEAIAKLSKGTSVKVIDSFKNSSGELWYRIESGAIKGWIIEDYLKADAEVKPPAPVKETKTVQIDKAPVRKGATDSYSIITYVNKNQSVTIIDTFKNANGEVWYRADLGSVQGWIKETAFQAVTLPPAPETGTKTVMIDKAPVRKGATDSYSVVTYVEKNQKVNIIDSFKNANGEIWYRADLGSVQGWIKENAFQAGSLPPAPETPDLPAIGSYVYSQVNSLDVRRGATSSYQSVGKLSLNQKVKVLDHFVHSSGEAWLRVEVNSSLAGWIPAKSASANQAINLKLYVSVDVANMRSGPSLSHSVIDQATKGAELTAFETAKDSTGDLWYKVKTSAGNIAWVHESVVSKQPSVSIGTTMLVGTMNAALYAGASYDYKISERLPYNSKVTVLGEFTNSLGQRWINIKSAAGKTGWTPEYELVTSQNIFKYVFAKKGAVIRKGAGTNYGISAYLAENDSLKILRKLNGWLNVENAKGTRGWVLETQTTTVSAKRLSSPAYSTVNGENYLTWIKPSNFAVSYTTLSSNRLKITGAMTDIEVPKGSIKGIKSIETFESGSLKSAVITFEPGYSFTLRDYSNKVSVKIVPFGLLGKKIVVDAGHGGKDPGAIGPSGLREKDVTLSTALLLKTELEKYGATVILTRSTDIFLELSERTTIANNSTGDAFISIHGDSFSSTSKGTTTYYNSTVNFNGPRSETLGNAIQKSMISSMNTYNRGVKEQNFYVNRMNQLPSVLVELAFISNPNEEALLKTTAFRQKAAVGITKGLEEYFNNF